VAEGRASERPRITPFDVERVLGGAFSFAPARKVVQLAAFLSEIAPLVRGRSREHVLVDVACGKSYLLLALAALVRPRARYIGVDRVPARIEACRAAAAQLGVPIELETCTIAEARLPRRPDVLLGLHACGGGTDQAIERAIQLAARHVLIVPCCHQRGQAALAARLVPRHGLLRGRLDDALADLSRTLRLEAAGYAVVAKELVPSSVTPHNLLLAARWVGETRRAERARLELGALARGLAG
jgi:hypothetical protein